jgi:UDP-N-acetylglucosamine pyrophosphorylase
MEGGAASELLYLISEGCALAIVSHAVSPCRDWERVMPPPENQILSYDQLPASVDVTGLAKLAVLKVNGGLGTSMG